MKRKNMTLDFGFIGLGRMAEVILQAMIQNKITSPKKVIVSRRSKAQLRKIQQRIGVQVSMDNSEVARQSRFLWIGVKPFQADGVLAEISSSVGPKHTVLSMMAGLSCKYLKKRLGVGPKLVRLMPNTPALLGGGMTGVYFPSGTPAKTQKKVKQILSTLGEVMVVRREADLDTVTGLSGSGPAFVYAMAEGLIQGGIDCGLSAKQARVLAIETLQGATQMLKKTGLAPEKLIKQVVSKGGTTEAGLKIMKKLRTVESITEAVTAATKRAQSIREDTE